MRISARTLLHALVLGPLLLAAASAPAQYPVGTADVTYLDPDRGDRPVPVDLYYPATTAGPDQPVAEPPAGGFASVSCGHGYLISPSVYSWVAVRLAEIGCVVAVPRTGGELFPDHAEFALDLAFTARALRDDGQDPGSPFFGRMGTAALVMGHSMGGGCSILAAAGDPSLTAVANFAAADTDPSAVAAAAEITLPALVMAGTNDCVAPPADHQIPIYQAMADNWRVLVTITGASHCQFNENSTICNLGEFCSADISREEQFERTWFLLEPWVQSMLFADGAAMQTFLTRLASDDGFTHEQAGITTAVEPVPAPERPTLRVAPNPFNPRTEITFELAAAGTAQLQVYTQSGRLVDTLSAGSLPAGRHTHVWDGRDRRGRSMPSGAYLVRLVADDRVEMVKVVLVR